MSLARYQRVLVALTLILGVTYIIATRVPSTTTSTTAAPAPVANTDAAPLPGHLAPDWILADLDGKQVQLSSLRGQVVLINVWATWCPPCRAEMPAIQSTYERYRADGFVVLAVNMGEDATTVARFMQSNRLTLPTLLDSNSEVASLYRASVMPSSFFVDRNGVVRAVYRGAMERGVIVAMVEQLLAEGR